MQPLNLWAWIWRRHIPSAARLYFSPQISPKAAMCMKWAVTTRGLQRWLSMSFEFEAQKITETQSIIENEHMGGRIMIKLAQFSAMDA